MSSAFAVLCVWALKKSRAAKDKGGTLKAAIYMWLGLPRNVARPTGLGSNPTREKDPGRGESRAGREHQAF